MNWLRIISSGWNKILVLNSSLLRETWLFDLPKKFLEVRELWILTGEWRRGTMYSMFQRNLVIWKVSWIEGGNKYFPANAFLKHKWCHQIVLEKCVTDVLRWLISHYLMVLSKIKMQEKKGFSLPYSEIQKIR